MTPATCTDGEWLCAADSDAVCTCAGTTAAFDCVSSCAPGADATFPFCVFGDHWECPSDTIRSDSCAEALGESAE
jgi:hypothetical protein